VSRMTWRSRRWRHCPAIMCWRERFNLLNDFPGRFTGDQVWVQRDQDRSNDSVSPVIIGGNDWASAWAIDGSGRNPYAVIPGGQRSEHWRTGLESTW